jgi:hypothetical protein
VKRIDKDEALRLLGEVVDERGEDYVYQRPDGSTCVYAEGDDEDGYRASCGVGLVLAKVGVPVDVLILLDKVNQGRVDPAQAQGTYLANAGSALAGDRDFVRVLAHEANLRLTSGAEWVLRRFQASQDSDDTYATALRYTQEEAKDFPS